MCDPTVALAVGALGTLTSVVGGVQQAQSQASMAGYQAQVARNNQMIAEQNSKAALDAGKAQADQQRLKTASLIGSQVAGAAANGLDPNSGSPLGIRESTAKLGELDTQTILDRSRRQSYNYLAEGNNFGAQAGLYDAQKSNISGGIGLNAIGGLLGGASQFASKWYQFNSRDQMSTQEMFSMGQAPAPKFPG